TTLRVLAHSDRVNGVVFAPDERQVASACADKRLRIWDVEQAAPPVVLEGHDGVLTDVAFASDGRIATASADGTVRLWRDIGELRPSDERLWRPSNYCLSVGLRLQLL